MDRTGAFYVFILKEFMARIFGLHYPIDIVRLIIEASRIKRVKLNCGSHHSGLIYGDETYIWGLGAHGELGLSSTCHHKYLPEKLPLQNAINICCGAYHTIALVRSAYLNTSNDIYVWGKNNHGQLGLGITITHSVTPHKLSLPNVIAIDCGKHYAVALTKLNEIYAWGSNKYGQLGSGDYVGQFFPQKLISFTRDNIVSVCCGAYHAIAVLRNSNKMYVWGDNGWGQLGLVWVDSQQQSAQELYLLQPIISVSCGKWHTVALVHTPIMNSLFVWGSNESGQLGTGDFNICTSPNEIFLPEAIESVCCGAFHTVALTKTGILYVWGSNGDDQLGLGRNIVHKCSPKKLSLENVIAVGCGKLYTIALTKSKSKSENSDILYSWGNNRYGQLGLGDTSNQTVPEASDSRF